MENGKEQTAQAVRTMNFDPASLLKNGDCKFQSDAGGEVKLNLQYVRMIASVADGATLTDAECLFFIRKCETWKLDPFLGEVFLIKGKRGPAATVVAADAYLRKVDVHPDYEGYETGWMVSEGDDKKQALFCLEPFAPISAQQTIVGSWCRVYRKGRKTPIQKTLTAEVQKTDFNGKPQSTWATMPLSQTVKCNLSQAHRRVFPSVLAGIYTTDERPDLFVRDIKTEYNTDTMPQTTPRQERTPDEPVTITLDTAQKALIDEFDSQCRDINPDITSVDMQQAFFAFMAMKFGGETNSWVDLMSGVWSVKICQEALAILQNNGIPEEIVETEEAKPQEDKIIDHAPEVDLPF